MILNKRLVIIFIVGLLLIGITLGLYYKVKIDNDKHNEEEKIVYIDAIDDSNIIINEDLNIEFGKIKYLSDFIALQKGKLKNKIVNYNDLGIINVKFTYDDEENNTLYRTINLNVIDTTKPLASVPSTKTIKLGTDATFVENFLCADNHDQKPNCHLEGEYNPNEVGTYEVTFVAEDISGNKYTKEMNINVVENIPISDPKKNTINYIPYENIYNSYKTDNTKIGIDVSRWQGDINFDLLKENNVEFIMIRLGGQDGIDGDLYLDSKFKRNIDEATRVGIPFGVYFYSYAYNKKQAVEQAKYVIENLKGYKLDLPIVYDWECWSSFNKFGISLFDATSVQNEFLNYVENKGYKSARYGSKNYLINAWQDSIHYTWLAHYIDQTNYEGDYFMWQRSDSGKIPGINGAVDVDILYLDKFTL